MDKHTIGYAHGVKWLGSLGEVPYDAWYQEGNKAKESTTANDRQYEGHTLNTMGSLPCDHQQHMLCIATNVKKKDGENRTIGDQQASKECV